MKVCTCCWSAQRPPSPPPSSSTDTFIRSAPATREPCRSSLSAPPSHTKTTKSGRSPAPRRSFREAPDASIGLAVGTAFCGELGGHTRREYAAIGDTMNIAARLMQLAEPGTVLCTGSIGRRARAQAVLRSRPPVTVKGRRQPVAIVELQRLRDQPVSTVREPGSELPLVGRDEELARIDEAIEGARNGIGRVVLVGGEAGIGKSRLSAEAVSSAQASGFSAQLGASSPSGASTPFLPWRPTRSLPARAGGGRDRRHRGGARNARREPRSAGSVAWVDLGEVDPGDPAHCGPGTAAPRRAHDVTVRRHRARTGIDDPATALDRGPPVARSSVRSCSSASADRSVPTACSFWAPTGRTQGAMHSGRGQAVWSRQNESSWVL